MNYHYLSNKQKRDLKKKKDEQKKVEFEEFKKRLAEDYLELYDNDFMEFYNYFLDTMQSLNIPVREDFYYKFRGFLIQNSIYYHLTDYFVYHFYIFCFLPYFQSKYLLSSPFFIALILFHRIIIRQRQRCSTSHSVYLLVELSDKI